MWWLFLEAAVALSLLVGIVWWTMFPPKKKPHVQDQSQLDAKSLDTSAVPSDAAQPSGTADTATPADPSSPGQR